TFGIVYGRPKSEQAMKEAARFDLIDAGANIAVSDGSTWPMLKKLNPHVKIFVYEMGPGECTASGKLNRTYDWEWITANHGLTSADRWTAVGVHGDYVQNNSERLMLIGNPGWQQYWLDEMYKRFWSPTSPNREADGVFSDNTDYEWPSEGIWYREGHP